MSRRFVLLGLAGVRATWPRDVTGWAMSGALPIEFTKCVSAEEVRARLRSGRTHSAVLIGSDALGVDRDLMAVVTEFGCAAIVVGSDDVDWTALGATARLHEVFGRDELLDRLEQCATPVGGNDDLGVPSVLDDQVDTDPSGSFVAVTGRGGAGATTLAAALAQELAAACGRTVALADLQRRADLAMLHDATDVVPGLQELVEAHRHGTCSATRVRSMTYRVPNRGYDLLLGRRRTSDWVSLRPAATAAALGGLRTAYDVVVADVDADLEGERETGSIDVEDRNVASRLGVELADLVLVVSDPSLSGVHRLVTIVDELDRHGVDAARIVPVLNHAPRSPRTRAELHGSLVSLVDPTVAAALHPTLFVSARRHVDDTHRRGTRLPVALGKDLATAVNLALDRLGPATRASAEPEPVAVGSLGTAELAGGER